MRVLAKDIATKVVQNQAIQLFEVRLGSTAPVVQSAVAKPALGPSANSYFNSVAEAGAITAVITSIGQIPAQPADIKPAPTQSITLQPEPLSVPGAYQPLLVSNQSIFAETPIQSIVSLSETKTDTLPSNFYLDQSVSTQSLREGDIFANKSLIANEGIISIQHLASLDLDASGLAKSIEMVGAFSGSSSNQGIANSAPNFSGIGTLINLTPVSTVTSLGAQVSPESNSVSLLDGITVSGQADGAEIFLISTRGQEDGFGALTMNPAGNLSSAQSTDIYMVFEQNSIILISVPSSLTPDPNLL